MPAAIKRKLFHYFIGVARRYGETILNGKPVPLTGRLLYALGNYSFTARSRTYSGSRACASPIRPAKRSARICSLLPLDRSEPEAALRADRSFPLCHRAARRRNLFRHRRSACPNVDIRIAEEAKCSSSRRACSSAISRIDAKTAEAMTPDGYVKTGEPASSTRRPAI